MEQPSEVSKKEKESSLPEEAKVMFKNLKDVLMDSISKVQESSEYIKQAKSINQSASNILKLAKIQLDIIKFDSNSETTKQKTHE